MKIGAISGLGAQFSKGTKFSIMYMYHKRPLDAQNARPIPVPKGPKAAEASGQRPGAGHCRALKSRGYFGGAAVSPPGPQRIIGIAQMLIRWVY